MSFVSTMPEALQTAATDLATIRSSLGEANAAAATATTEILPAGADDVSAAIAALFSVQSQVWRTFSEDAAWLHQQFVDALNGSAIKYATTELENAERNVLHIVNEPTEYLFGRPLIGNGANGAPGRGKTAGTVAFSGETAVTADQVRPATPAATVVTAGYSAPAGPAEPVETP
ncbi:PE family protein [Mycobacterium kansasii 732]|nr:PE family protein [Mycobacterium kansasii 732]